LRDTDRRSRQRPRFGGKEDHVSHHLKSEKKGAPKKSSKKSSKKK